MNVDVELVMEDVVQLMGKKFICLKVLVFFYFYF